MWGSTGDGVDGECASRPQGCRGDLGHGLDPLGDPSRGNGAGRVSEVPADLVGGRTW